MRVTDESDMTHLQGVANQASSGQPTANESLFAPAVFAEFVALLGRAQAAVWLGRFLDELKAECLAPLAMPRDAAQLRGMIHRICGRAGLIGFPALQEACLVFLEADTRQGEPTAVYRRICTEAARVFPEIERHRAALA